MNISSNNYNSIANHNLSSVLSQIQDNGPAYENSMKQKYHKQVSNNDTPRDNTATTQLRDELDDDTLSISSSGSQNGSGNQAVKSNGSKKEISPGIWLQLLLLLISAAILTSTLFRLDAQTNTIENSFSVYDETIDEKIQESVDLQRVNSTDGSTKLHAALQSLQKELQLIKTDYSTLDKKYVALAQNKASSKAHNTSAAQKDASTFKYEILSLKSELQTVKNKLNLTNGGTRLPTQTTANNGLTVTLASLSNKNTADRIVQQLYAEGLQPNIEQAIVRGERIYRLSVSGFFNRDEAESFIRKAGKKYGMKDSRIRKS